MLGSQLHDVLALVHLEPTFPDSIGRELQFTHDHAVDQHFGTIGHATEPLVVDLDDITWSASGGPGVDGGGATAIPTMSFYGLMLTAFSLLLVATRRLTKSAKRG